MLTPERLGALFGTPVTVDRVGGYVYARPTACRGESAQASASPASRAPRPALT